MNQTQGNTIQDILKWEQENHFSRETVTVKEGETLAMGAVIGRIAKSIPATGTPAQGNGGDGTVTGVAGGPDAKIGTYTLECAAEAENGGTFRVTSPDGDALPDAAVGTAYVNSQLHFTINDGSADFDVGDVFTIEISPGSGKVVEIDFAAVDGSQEAFGFVIAACDAAEGDRQAVAIVRDAIIVPDDLVWPSGATEGQKMVALARLAEKGIVTREEA